MIIKYALHNFFNHNLSIIIGYSNYYETDPKAEKEIGC